MRDPVAALGHGRSVPWRVAARRGPGAADKKIETRRAENATLPCAARGLGGIIVRRLSCPRLLASTVLRATPSFGEHRLFGNTSGGAGVCHA